MSIYDPIFYWGRVAPNRAACAFPGGTVTYAQLCNGAGSAAIAFQRGGFRQTDLINVAVVNPVFQLMVLLALGRIGAGAAMLTPKNLNAVGELPIHGLITDDPQFPWAAGKRKLVLDHKWFVSRLAEENPPRPSAHVAAPDDLLRIVTTSGATGTSKGVAITHGMAEGRLRTASLQPESRKVLSMVAPQASWGYLNALKVLRAGGTYCLAPFPDQCLDLCDSFGVEVICASVAQIATLVGEQRKKQRELFSLKYILLGGSIVAPGLIADVQRLICKDVCIGYGASEVGQIAAAPVSLLQNNQGAVGYLYPGAEVEIVDENNRRMAPDRIGTIRMRSNGSSTGYLNASEDAEGVFTDGWFYPGDRGQLTRDGLLIVEGRTSELVLNKGGLKLNPANIEDKILHASDIKDVGVVAGFSESGAPEIWAAVVTSPGTFNLEAFKKKMDELLGGFAPDRYFTVDVLPRNEAGKVQYKLLRDKLTDQNSKPKL